MAMFGEARTYVLKIVADVKDAVKGIDKVGTETKTMKDKALGIGKAVAAGLAAGAVVEFGKSVVDAAADADDGMDAIAKGFGSASKEIENFSKGAAENMGMSRADFQKMAALTGSTLQSMGIGADKAAKMTESLSTRAADMAAIYGTSTGEAMDAINRGMAGSTKSLRKFGVVIDNAQVNARAMKEGYVDASGKVTQAGKAIASQEIILEKTAGLQGAWADNSKDLGSQQDILKAKLTDLQATIGTALLPIITTLMEKFQPILDFISTNISWLAPLAAGIIAVVGAVAAYNAVMGLWESMTLIATGVQVAFNAVWAAFTAVLYANPILLIIAGIVALIALFVVLYKKVDWFRNAVDASVRAVVNAFQWVINWLRNNWPLVIALITGPFGTAVYLVVKNWGTIKTMFSTALNWLRDNFAKVTDYLAQPFIAAWHTIEGVGDWIVNKFKDVVHLISWLFGGVKDAILWPFKLAFEGIKWAWNNTVGGFGFTLPSWVPGGLGGKGFEFPRMAKGGIVSRPTIALIGEAGPEAVVPLNQISQVQPQQTVVINVYALTSNAEVGRKVFEALQEYNRTTGKVA